MYTRAKKLYRTARLAFRFFRFDELKGPSKMPWAQRLGYLRHGFLSQAGELYNLEDYSLEDYFSDWAKARMSMMYDNRNVRAGYPYGLNNKFFSTAILGQHLPVPRILGCIENGRVISLTGDTSGTLGGSWTDACRGAGSALVMKPAAGSCGRGVLFLEEHNGKLALNGHAASEHDIDAEVGQLDEYIIVEFIRQGAYANSLYPGATNTIRMITILDPDNGETYLPMAVQRIGRDASRPVDNWFQSGLSAEVDIETGTLSRAASRETVYRKLTWHENHPDTGAPIKGMKVPNWDAIKETILDTASRLAYFKFLSWDVVTQDDGIVLIEADTVSAIDLMQVHRPLLKDKRLLRFLQYHGLVRD